MGSPTGEQRWNGYKGEEEPIHEVNVLHFFALGQTPVTVDAFSVFVADTGYDTGNAARVLNPETEKWADVVDADWRTPGYRQSGNHPVTCVNWDDACSYVAWVNACLGLHGSYAYRLPTEAEWEYACRAGSTTIFNVGDTLKTSQANINGKSGYAGEEPEKVWRKRTTPVGQFALNAFGLADMHGNCWEWSNDPWNSDYQQASQAGDSPQTGDDGQRVVRGGSWGSFPRYCRSAMRGHYARAFRGADVGFRLARSIAP